MMMKVEDWTMNHSIAECTVSTQERFSLMFWLEDNLLYLHLVENIITLDSLLRDQRLRC